MDGSSLSLIIIPITTAASLATWLILVAYAASHPTWKHGLAAPQGARTASPLDAQIPRPARQPAETRPMVTAGTPATEPSITQGDGR